MNTPLDIDSVAKYLAQLLFPLVEQEVKEMQEMRKNKTEDPASQNERPTKK